MVFRKGYCTHFNLHVDDSPNVSIFSRDFLPAKVPKLPCNVQPSRSEAPPLSQLKPIQNYLLEPCTPVIPHKLTLILGDHPQVDFLVNGFQYGSVIPHTNVPLECILRNHMSARVHHSFLHNYIQEELCARRIAGPYSSPPHPAFVASPLGVVTKKDLGHFVLFTTCHFLKAGW